MKKKYASEASAQKNVCVSTLSSTFVVFLVKADPQIILENLYFKISLQIHIIVVRNQNNGENPHILTFFRFENRQFAFLPSGYSYYTIHNVYCVSNAVDYAKKNDVLPTILSTFSLELRGQ